MELAQEIRRISAREAVLPAGIGPEGPRRRILEAALGLFAERGFAGASIRDIAAAAGVRSATLYAHYNAKEQILADLVRIGHEDHHARLAAAATGEPAAQLAAIAGAHVRWHAEHPLLATVANAELHALSPALAAESLALRDASTELLVSAIRRGAEIGVFAPADVWMAAAAIGGMGIRVANWFAPDGDYAVDEVVAAYSNFALCIARGTNA